MRAFVLLLLAAPAAAASAAPYELSVGSSVRGLPGADPVTADDLSGGGVGLGRRLELELPAHLELWTEASSLWSGANGAMFQTLTTRVFDLTLTAGAHVRYHALRNLAVSGALAIGYQHASLSIEDTMGHTASDTAWGPVARASVQLDVLAVDRPAFALGLRGELGYLAAAGIAMTPTERRTDSSDTLHIPMQEASVGHLDLGGPFFTISVLSQF
ncbi:MAG: hypothetical protein ABI467_13765 [Kofleriaceae bacterium]